MRDRNRRPSLGSLIQRRLNDLLTLRIQSASRLIKEQDARIPQEGAGNSHALFLAAAQQSAFGAADGGEAVGETGDEVVNVCVAAGLFDFGVGHVVAVGAQQYVLADRALVERRFLRDEREVGAVVVDVEAGDVVAVDEDGAGEGVVEALE